MRVQTFSLILVLLFIGQLLVFIQFQAPDAGAAVPSPVKLVPYANNPLFGHGPQFSWDQEELKLNCVIRDSTGYKLYYSGGYWLDWPSGIGVATSTDGKTWTQYSGNPIVIPGPWGSSWDGHATIDAKVLKDGNTYKMWYVGSDGSTYRTGYATSSDGLSWAKYSGNPLNGNVGAVINENGVYKTWHDMSDGIGYATSPDGLDWTEYQGNPVLTLGNPGTFDSQGEWTWSVLNRTGRLEMWYTGWNGQLHAIGYAESPDGLSWTKCDSNPILTGSGAGWDKIEDRDMCTLFNGTGYQMWYGGVNKDVYPWPYQIGYAEGWNFDLHTPVAIIPDNNTWTNKAKPTLGWNFNDTNSSDRQGSFQVQVATDDAFSTLKYDSGRIDSGSMNHTLTSALPDGIYYWRVKVWTPCDEMSDWTEPQVMGIDTVAPLNPVKLASTTHQPGVWCPDNIVNISWELPYHGDFSGYGGFSASWDISPSSLPDKKINLDGDVTNISSPALPDGKNQYFHIRAVDRAGNWATGTATFGPIDIDTSVPTNPSIDSMSHEPKVWNGNDNIDISFSGAGGGTSGLAGYGVIWDTLPKTAPSGPVNVTPDMLNVTSPSLPDGNSWYFHLRAMNNAGTWANDTVHAGPFFIDTTPPNISMFSIDNGASSTNDPLASLTMSAMDPMPGSGMANMRFSLDGNEWTAWEPFNEMKTLNLTGPDGDRNVYLQVQDQTGNVQAVANAGIFLDTHPPTVFQLQINGGAAYSNSSDVVVTADATDEEPGSGLADMALSTNNLTWSAWEPFSPSKNITLPLGEGVRSVFMKVRDNTGNVGEVAEADIQVDTVAPGSLAMVIDSGAEVTNNRTVQLTLSATDPAPASGLGEMSFSGDGIKWTPWEPFRTTRDYLFSKDGTQTIYFRVRDRTNNTAVPVNASILVDTTLPLIMNIDVINEGRNNASIEVTTSEPCKLILNYGAGKTLKYSVVWDDFTKDHVFELQKLGAGTTYHFTISATDRGGNPATVSEDQKFSTTAESKTPVGPMPLVAGLIVAMLLMRKKRWRP